MQRYVFFFFLSVRPFFWVRNRFLQPELKKAQCMWLKLWKVVDSEHCVASLTLKTLANVLP